VSLDPAFEGLVWPSKIYGIEAAGRPWVRLRPGLEVEDLREAARETPNDPRPCVVALERWNHVLDSTGSPGPCEVVVAIPARPGSSLNLDGVER
jgi:hypothetical protein